MKKSIGHNDIDANKILNYIKDNNLTIKRFCELCKMSCTTFKKIIDGKTNVWVMWVFRIANVMGIKVCEIFIKCE